MVLLVDDEKTILDVLTLSFRKAGIETKRAESVEDAIVLLEGERFAAVITDKNFPGRSGLELLKYLKDKHPHCAALMITGFANTESVLEAMRAGADDYLLKPFESLALVVERVKSAITHRRTQLERALLAEAVHELQKSLRQSESKTFTKMTELDLLQNVVDVRIEDATSELKARLAALEGQSEKVAELESELAAEKKKRATLRAALLELAKSADAPLRAKLEAEAAALV